MNKSRALKERENEREQEREGEGERAMGDLRKE